MSASTSTAKDARKHPAGRVPLKPALRDLRSGMVPTAEELRFAIRHHSGTLTLQITPELATVLLDFNTGNRRLSEARAQAYAEMMRAGRWMQTGEPLICSRESLNTGQHRLRAVQLFGKPVEFDIRFGVSRAAFVMTDTGRPHNASDVLHIRGVPHYAMVSAVVRLIVLYEMGLPAASHRTVPNDLISGGFDRFADVVEVVRAMNGLSWPRGLRTSVLDATVWFAKHSSEEAKAMAFATMVSTGATEDINNPARTLRERLLREASTRRNFKQIERFALCLRAWNAFRDNRPLAQVYWRGHGSSAQAFPTVDNFQFE